MVDDRCDDINNFTIYEGGGSVTNEEGTLDGHTDYLKISCLDANEDSSWADNAFDSGQASGTIYYSWRFSAAIGNTYQHYGKNQTAALAIYLYVYWTTDELYAYDGAAHYVCDVAIDTWYDMQIVFNCDSDQYDVIVDEDNKGTFNFRNVSTTINNMRFNCADKDADYDMFIDQLYYSWDSGGWTHKIIGIVNANISSINSIAKTDISKVNSV